MAHYYNSQELGGLSVQRFTKAVLAEGATCGAGCNKPLHSHSIFTDMDIYNQGKPTQIVNLPDSMTVEQLQKPLAVSETINDRITGLPRFIYFDKKLIEQYASAYRKVIENYAELLADDTHLVAEGGYSATYRDKK